MGCLFFFLMIKPRTRYTSYTTAPQLIPHGSHHASARVCAGQDM